MTNFAFTTPTAAAIALGAAGGALGRWGLSHLVHQTVGHGFPYGTLSVNVLGCLAIGIVSAFLSSEERSAPEWLHAGIVLGVLGGFTTFSTFGRETMLLLRDDRMAAALTYVLASNVAGLAALWLGWFAFRQR
ncbi:MAG TPA: fluoride efflux transporter CrcB [Phycisphaerales bacterium]|nr:fluoride efflux transporter CrcB [Phycisphaerales bacterium]HMP36954.1 fluoride efflux transporter CrcB [Phycisphaerales bacterium]